MALAARLVAVDLHDLGCNREGRFLDLGVHELHDRHALRGLVHDNRRFVRVLVPEIGPDDVVNLVHCVAQPLQAIPDRLHEVGGFLHGLHVGFPVPPEPCRYVDLLGDHCATDIADSRAILIEQHDRLVGVGHIALTDVKSLGILTDGAHIQNRTVDPGHPVGNRFFPVEIEVVAEEGELPEEGI